ncbi:MAG: hypothetical protein QOG34_1938 [Frankiaceae bacterium]|nr:hypothetical protein [Frankiaceae bacterium]
MRQPLAGIVLTVAMLGSGVVLAPAANAIGNNTTIGGCAFDTSSAPGSDGTTRTGVTYELSVTHDPSGLPIGATVSCKIEVNGVDAPGTTFSYLGYGEQAGADRVSFEADDGDVIQPCQRTVYADNTDTGWSCATAHNLILPPQELRDTLDFVSGIVDNVFVWDVDPRLCPVLAAHAGTYGPITIHPDGDVYIADPLNLALNPAQDCPPYGNF